MKKVIALVSTAVLMFSSVSFATGVASGSQTVVIDNSGKMLRSASDVAIQIDGQEIQFSSEKPYINLNNKTMVPVIEFAKRIGGNAEWSKAAQTITLTYNDIQTEIAIAKKSSVGAGEDNATVTVKRGNAYIPLRYLAGLLGFSIEWDGSNRIANLITAEEEQDNVVNIDETSDAQTVEVNKGQTVKLSLSANPTTGYNWSYGEEPDSTIIKEISSDYKSSSDLMGAGGTSTWIFEAVGEGTVTLSLNYSRVWESVQPAKTFTVTVNVK